MKKKNNIRFLPLQYTIMRFTLNRSETVYQSTCDCKKNV